MPELVREKCVIPNKLGHPEKISPVQSVQLILRFTINDPVAENKKLDTFLTLIIRYV